MELMKAEDVPQHEAETYLDLLGGGSGAEGHHTGSKSKHNKHRKDRLDSDEEDDLDLDIGSDDDNASDAQRDEDERSMKDLVKEQDALNGTWTKQMIEKENQRRKAFAKKRKQQ